jgi:hypothetical protein
MVIVPRLGGLSRRWERKRRRRMMEINRQFFVVEKREEADIK